MGSKGWWLDEAAYAGRENLDIEHVARYDTKTGDFGIAEELALLGEFGLGVESTLVDFGAGTGTFALAAAATCGRVIAVDPSPVMRSALSEKIVRAGMENIECVEGGFLSYAPAAPVDVVYSRNALHHLPDFWKVVALQRIAEMLRPGGVLRLRDVVYNFEPSEIDARLETWLATASGTVECGWTVEELHEHVRDEHSTFTWLLEPMLERAGLRISAVSYSESGIYARYVCTKPA
jgi:SAM-dependent methyltransferase